MTCPLAPVFTLWIGADLGPVGRACLASFAGAGHPVHLYAYDALPDPPAGVSLRDAEDVLPRREIRVHRATGSPALFSNRFRYEALRRGLGTWVDCDVLCLRPLPDDAFLFGWQDERRINGAVLRLPGTHPVVADLLRAFEDPRWVPPWFRLDRRLRAAVRRRFDPGFGIEDLRWGTTGPDALTHYLARHGLAALARPREAFYPLRLRDARDALAADPSAVARHVREGTHCVHLWRQDLLDAFDRPPPGTFLRAVADGAWQEWLEGATRP